MKKIIIYSAITLLIVASISGCGKKAGPDRQKEEAIPVRAMKVEPRNLSRIFEYVGTIRGRDEAIVYPKVSGKIIEKAKEEGSTVTRGEAILYIDRDEVGLKFEKAPIESPLTGIVGRVYADIGSNVTTQTPVALVTDMEGVEINLNVPEKYEPELAIGQRAVILVDAYPGEEFRGRVTEISPVLDIDTRSAPVEITIEDREHKLRSGMFAKIKLILEEHKNAPAILKESIIGKGEDVYVYTVDDKNASFKKVVLGIREGPYFEVVDGVKIGDEVVIMGQHRLKDGALVAVERED